MDSDQLAYHVRLKARAQSALGGLSRVDDLTVHMALQWIDRAIDGDVSQYDPEVEHAADEIEGVLFRRAEACRAELERADLLDTVEALL